MTFYTGFNFTFISLDRPSIGAGRSYVGVFGDEVKYFPEEKFTNLLKAVRGFRVKYGDSVWYRSRTLTTDMPNPNHLGEYDWVLKYAKQNNKDKILFMARAGFVYNETKREYVAAMQRYDDLQKQARHNPKLAVKARAAERMMNNAKRNMERWEQRWIATRRGVSLFFISSSFVNVDILGEDWFSDEFAEGLEGMECNILFTLLIDQYNCPNLKSEMEVTGTEIKTQDKSRTSVIVKEKKGDKLPTARLPKESTNLTDALKYLILRREVIRIWEQGRVVSGAASV